MLKFRRKEKTLNFKDDGNVGLVLSQELKDKTYMILETPLLIESKLYEYGTIVSAKKGLEGKLWIEEVITESKYVTDVYCWSKEAINSTAFKKLSKKLLEIGGACDVAMGGVVSIYYPKNVGFNLSEEIEKIENLP
ncbi:hypothetical protein [Aquimarina sp. 433]